MNNNEKLLNLSEEDYNALLKDINSQLLDGMKRAVDLMESDNFEDAFEYIKDAYEGIFAIANLMAIHDLTHADLKIFANK